MTIFEKLSKFLEKKKRSKYWKLIGYTRRLVFLGSKIGIRIDTKWHHIAPNYFLKRRISIIFRRASFWIFQEKSDLGLLGQKRRIGCPTMNIGCPTMNIKIHQWISDVQQWISRCPTMNIEIQQWIHWWISSSLKSSSLKSSSLKSSSLKSSSLKSLCILSGQGWGWEGEVRSLRETERSV